MTATSVFGAVPRHLKLPRARPRQGSWSPAAGPRPGRKGRMPLGRRARGNLEADENHHQRNRDRAGGRLGAHGVRSWGRSTPRRSRASPGTGETESRSCRSTTPSPTVHCGSGPAPPPRWAASAPGRRSPSRSTTSIARPRSAWSVVVSGVGDRAGRRHRTDGARRPGRPARMAVRQPLPSFIRVEPAAVTGRSSRDAVRLERRLGSVVGTLGDAAEVPDVLADLRAERPSGNRAPRHPGGTRRRHRPQAPGIATASAPTTRSRVQRPERRGPLAVPLRGSCRHAQDTDTDTAPGPTVRTR